MKILFLLPPSEGKNSEWSLGIEKLSYNFQKPSEIAVNVTEKDLKCTGNRYEEWINLNKTLCSPLLEKKGNQELQNISPAVNRYTWVMFNAIDYAGMSDDGQKFFENNFCIFSWMYGAVSPKDSIGNYKLPIETKWLAKFWQEKITQMLNNSEIDYIVNLLPLSYQKMINMKTLSPQLININFLTEKNGKIVKISHWVKKIKGEWIKNICETLWKSRGSISNDELFLALWWEKVETEKSIEINIF